MRILDKAKYAIRRIRGLKEQRGEQIYKIGDFQLTLPCSHLLPHYQAHHRLYDRFLPFIGPANLDGWIVDVGANVGDSAAALTSGSPKKILCIEPSRFFGRYLSINAQVMRRSGSEIRIAELAVSSRENAIILSEGSSTATRGASGYPVLTSTLDELVKLHCDRERVSFIKTDVDGYDADVLLSGVSTIKNYRPSLFFECDVRSVHEIEVFVQLFEMIRSMNYRIMCLDNFGLPLSVVNDTETFANMLRYIAWQHAGTSTRTFYYLDCFACRDDDLLMLDIYRSYLDFVEV